jgi:hypothetical protein
LAGAVLAELTLLVKVDIAGAGEEHQEGSAEGPGRDADWWRPARRAARDVRGRAGSKLKDLIGKVSRKLRDQVLAGLAERGILRADKHRVLGLFPVTRWPEAHPALPDGRVPA